MSVPFRSLARLFGTGVQPAAPGAGDIWYRTDLAQVHASDGGAGLPLTIGPAGNLPVVRSTRWHTLPAIGSTGAVNFPADRLFALPFWPGRSCTLTAMAVNVTLALVGGNIRMGLYDSDGSIPTTLLDDYGTVSVGVTGVRSITGLSRAVRPTLHYLVVARQGGVLNLGLTARDTGDAIVSEVATPSFAAGLNAYYRDGVSGALPAPFGAISGSINSPAVSVQLT